MKPALDYHLPTLKSSRRDYPLRRNFRRNTVAKETSCWMLRLGVWSAIITFGILLFYLLRYS